MLSKISDRKCWVFRTMSYDIRIAGANLLPIVYDTVQYNTAMTGRRVCNRTHRRVMSLRECIVWHAWKIKLEP